MQRFPWGVLMATGLGRLKLSPREFWAATPREIAAAFPSKSGFSRGVLEALLQQFPDET